MTRIRAALFDLDGTLTDTLTDISTAMNRSLELHGLPTYPREDYRYLVGNGARNLALRAVRDRVDLHEAVLADYQSYYEKHSLVHTRPYDGIPEMLSELEHRGIALCVLSNKPDADTRLVVSHFFPGVSFAVVRGQLPGSPIKPDPTVALQIAHGLGIAPSSWIYLGDTSVDMICACNAGMCPVGVLWGFRDETELRESGARVVLSSPSALLPWLDDSERA